ncbi:hypothetical protein S7711_01316 [Stachybotrys chartarum IBT 7711]|uniref:Uncharacterized protein n=1 Tax=Stachybotrys chartarum (strain CBS 109288 / IBT 7711) TaxID=1280523 RepID=A0A084BBN8_STACB|nr:hypothetical protein S7711_01316 [Stachybotrys chartarum IBT 7711]
MRMALTHEDTPAGLALFSAILAFSSLHRDGLQQDAIQFKISALQFLSASTTAGPLPLPEAAKHAAASMVLAAFEELPSPNPSHAILNLLSEICDTGVAPWDPMMRNDNRHDSLIALQEKVKNVAINSVGELDPDTLLGSRIWQIATRLYLARASQSRWGASDDLEIEINREFGRITEFSTCRHFFPLFILAWEAQTDERRAAIIGLIDRTERSPRMGNLKQLRHVIQSIWVQQDLHVDTDLLLNYLGIIRVVVGSTSTHISFA